MFRSTARFEGQEKKQELGQVPGTTLRKERAHGTSLDQDHLGLAGALIHCPPCPHTKAKAVCLRLFRKHSALKISPLIQESRFRTLILSEQQIAVSFPNSD